MRALTRFATGRLLAIGKPFIRVAPLWGHPQSSSLSIVASKFDNDTLLRRFSSTAITDRPFRILGIQQVAIGNEERDPLIHLWMNILGLQAHKMGTRMEKENVVEDTLSVGAFCGNSKVEIDLMTPIDIEAHPRVHKPPLHHVGLWVDDLKAAVEWMGQQGVRFTPGGIRKGAAGHDICFIHPKGNESNPVCGNGVLIELVQAPADVIAATTKDK